MELGVALVYSASDLETGVIGNDELLTGKIAWAHLKEILDYYTRLAKVEAEAES